MKRVYVILMAALFCVCTAHAGQPLGQIDQFRYMSWWINGYDYSGWARQGGFSGNGTEYTSLVSSTAHGLFGHRSDGGIDRIQSTGTQSISDNRYLSIAAGSDGVYAANPNGGIKKFTFSGSTWNASSLVQYDYFGRQPIQPPVYSALYSLSSSTNSLWAARLDGGIDQLQYMSWWINGYDYSGWANTGSFPSSGATYTSLAFSSDFGLFGHRSDGGIDRIQSTGAQSISDDRYLAIAAGSDGVYAANPNGGIKKLTFNGSTWNASFLTQYDYFGRQPIHPPVYSALYSSSSLTNEVWTATIPEPASLLLLGLGGMLLRKKRM